MTSESAPIRVFLVAGEHSGDQLGAKLIPELRRQAKGEILFSVVGGEMMAEQGCPSLFPLHDVAVMGPVAIISRLPRIIRRVYQTVNEIIRFAPDVLVILDSPEFTHPIAKRVRRRRPGIPIVNYVSPSVWAWRPGRAKKMRGYVDLILALLPFETEAHRRLSGPECVYVGHPLIERQDWIQSLDASETSRKLNLKGGLPVLVVLPGSRPNEVTRLMEPFGKAIGLLQRSAGPIEVVVPAVNSVRTLIESYATRWPVRPHIIEGEREKFQSFRLARAALAASGTVTLELALSGTPMIVAYKVEGWFSQIMRRLITASSAVLPNLVLGEKAFPEFIQEHCTPENLAGALLPLLKDSPERKGQLAAMQSLGEKMRLPTGQIPSGEAARHILGKIKS